jgi:23S rRNA (adenine2503-C2)-methyltransferase
MRYPDRATLCISSQAGCGMACPFCATGQGGLDRNLSTAEIVDQVRSAAAVMRDGTMPGGPGRLSNIVFMGLGEPLANGGFGAGDPEAGGREDAGAAGGVAAHAG